MQVSSLDAAPLLGNEKDASRPATTARDAFFLLLQNSFEPATNPGLLRLADASGLVRRLSAGREPIADARPVDDTVVREDDTVVEEPVNFNDEDADPAPNEEAMDTPNEKVADPVEQPEMQLFLSDTRIAPDTPISPTGAPAAIAAVSGQARASAAPTLPAAAAADGQTRAAAAPTLPADPTLPAAAADSQARATAARTEGQTHAPAAPILPAAAAADGQTRAAAAKANGQAHAPAAATDRLARAASQRPTTPQQTAVETVAPTIPLNEASAKSGNVGSPGKGAANGGIPATVTKPDPQLVSRPANTLAAAASLAAQTGKAGGPTDATAGNSAPVISDTTTNLLLSDTSNKTMNQGNGQRGASQGAATTTGNTPDVTTNTTAPSASFTASLAANQTPLPSAAVKPIPGVNQPTNTVSLESNALGGQTPAAASAARRPELRRHRRAPRHRRAR